MISWQQSGEQAAAQNLTDMVRLSAWPAPRSIHHQIKSVPATVHCKKERSQPFTLICFFFSIKLN